MRAISLVAMPYVTRPVRRATRYVHVLLFGNQRRLQRRNEAHNLGGGFWIGEAGSLVYFTTHWVWLGDHRKR